MEYSRPKDSASTGSMNSTEPRAQAMSAVSNPKILGVQAVRAAQNLEILRVLAVCNPEILAVHSSSPGAPTESKGRHLRAKQKRKERTGFALFGKNEDGVDYKRRIRVTNKS